MNGNRDTELAIFVRDNRFGNGLIRKLLAEHVGMKESDLPTFLLPFLQEDWHAVAKQNTETYRELFQKSIPDGEPANLRE